MSGWVRQVTAGGARVVRAVRHRQDARAQRVIERASGGALVGPPPRMDETQRLCYILFAMDASEEQVSWTLAHALDVVWRPVLTSQGIPVRADAFHRATGLGPAVFLAIVSGCAEGRMQWQGTAVDQMAATTGIPVMTIGSLNEHLHQHWCDALLGGHEIPQLPVCPPPRSRPPRGLWW